VKLPRYPTLWYPVFLLPRKKEEKKMAPQFSKPLASPKEKGINEIVARVTCKVSERLLPDRKSQTTLNTKP
jgi:hypothetical protein